MKINIDNKYRIDSNIIKKYIDLINSTTDSMIQIKMQKTDEDNSIKKSINQILDEIKKMTVMYPNNQTQIMTNFIKQIIKLNNGIITTRIIEPLGISRQYLSILESNNEIERVSRGIYKLPCVLEDSFYLFQSKYKKVIFSHMTSLYFYGMTEEFPYVYNITVPQSYHIELFNENHNVFYVSDDIIQLGITEIDTPNGNKVRVYDLERSICDIIRSKNRMDLEQVKKSIKQYMKSKNKDMRKLSEYSKKMGINKQVMEMVGMYND